MRPFASLLLALSALLAAACGGGSPTAPTSATPSGNGATFSEAAFREAARVTALAQSDVQMTVRPGLFERDIKAVVDEVFRRHGVAVPAFSHIVASGPNALVLHYEGDDRQLEDGDLLVVDIGAAVDEHCADVTRTIAVSGRFTARQREVYDLVLDALLGVEQRARAGADSLAGLHAWVKELFRQSPLRAADASGNLQTMDQFFIHSVGHFVGRTVHGQDTGWSIQEPLRAGQVLAIEPGLYLPAEGIGIRIEDTLLVTSDGLECLSCQSAKRFDGAPLFVRPASAAARQLPPQM